MLPAVVAPAPVNKFKLPLDPQLVVPVKMVTAPVDDFSEGPLLKTMVPLVLDVDVPETMSRLPPVPLVASPPDIKTPPPPSVPWPPVIDT